MSGPIALAGSTGTIGCAVAAELEQQGYEILALTRDDFGNPEVLADKLRGTNAIISCIASRTGSHNDAWAVDYSANVKLMEAAQLAGIARFVLLSAICVQKPNLAFQNAKRAFEARLRASGLDWTIVHPTAFFKSLSGQVARVKDGKPFTVFGDGKLTACKPISDADLARFLVGTVGDPATSRKVLPVGGPGPAITPLDQAKILSDLLGQDVKIRRIPIAMMNAIIRGLDILSIFSHRFADKAEFARIGHYYATESMLVWNEAAQQYDADATPEFGSDTLKDYYAALLDGREVLERGDHAVF
ncbi:MAG: NAD(P)H-binding protein [Pseudomonadota bacterium]